MQHYSKSGISGAWSQTSLYAKLQNKGNFFRFLIKKGDLL